MKRSNPNRSAFWLIFTLLLLVFNGCASLSLSPAPRLDPEALTIVRHVQAINQEIRSCKGTGWITTGPAAQRKRYRLAYAAVPPDKIRITLLASGFPVETILADGQTVRFISHTGDHSPYTFNSPDPSLENAFSIPIRMSDVIRLLSGRVPVPEFKHLYLVTRSDNQGVVDLKKDFGRRKYRLTVDRLNHPAALSYFNDTGAQSYAVTFAPFASFDPVTIPADWSVTSDTGDYIRVEITSFTANIPIKDKVFRLTDQG